MIEERFHSPALAVEDLVVDFETSAGPRRAVDGVSLSVERGAVLGVVGESGSGKSVTMRSVLGLLPPTGSVVSGKLQILGEQVPEIGDRALQAFRGARVGFVSQDPRRALNPTLRVGQHLVETLKVKRGLSTRAARGRALELVRLVGIRDPQRRIDAYPHELSGGMLQRVVIALAICCEPGLLIADEPTTALDVTTQADILDLLAEMRSRLGMALILVTHDLSVAATYTDRIAVMYAGRLVEAGPTVPILTSPRMPYTRGLLQSLPQLDTPSHARLAAIAGSPPAVNRGGDFCPFAPRCPRVVERCRQQRPDLSPMAPDQRAACWNPEPEQLVAAAGRAN